uniref:C2H2-type domain-containing protein n=1 Tax=viral metagenome TaxID=1070528 RepID=A0A6C0BBC8_9ZZZZ
MNSKDCCNYCGKGYTRKTSLQRHVLLCEIVHKTKREKICDQEETTDIPSRQQLYQIIQELAIKYHTQQQQIEEMQKWIQIKKRKMNLIEWLETNHPQSLPFQIWMKTIQVQEKHIDLLMAETIVQTITCILRDNLQPEKGKPFAAFSQKANTIYIFDESQQWQTFFSENYLLLIKQIHSRILRELCEWRNKHLKEIAENEKISEIYNKTVMKLMGLNFNQDSTALSKIRTNLYQYVKIEIKQTVELDFS